MGILLSATLTERLEGRQVDQIIAWLRDEHIDEKTPVFIYYDEENDLIVMDVNRIDVEMKPWV